ncbi:unnamed protein product [Macrosiphum euphorbiae]|uniref:Uncharacterized protein n=1 Tax=Macrosiphum euphorbiae TaxID=13131 RepID=A0AAV0X4K8_9HEMI|nr:unnamed protein product [Macrosiphum euphorbiae]
MLTVICFDEENCVEVVPSYWYKNGYCAWPKRSIRNPKKYVVHRSEPNELEFYYFKARPISKNDASLEDARSRLIIAQETSELSTYEEDKSTRNQQHCRPTNDIMDLKQPIKQNHQRDHHTIVKIAWKCY